MEKAEAEGGADDGWTLVQYKCKTPKVGLELITNGDHDRNYADRGHDRFTKVNKIVKWNEMNMITLKESDDEGGTDGDRDVKREPITIRSNSNG